MSRRRRGERLPRTRLPGVRSADPHTHQTAQAIPAVATTWRRRLHPLHRPDAFDPPAQSPCPPRWCPFISPGFGATIRLRGPLRHVLHTHHTTERFYNPTRAKAHTQHKPNTTHSATTHPQPRRTPALKSPNQKDRQLPPHHATPVGNCTDPAAAASPLHNRQRHAKKFSFSLSSLFFFGDAPSRTETVISLCNHFLVHIHQTLLCNMGRPPAANGRLAAATAALGQNILPTPPPTRCNPARGRMRAISWWVASLWLY